LGVATVQIRVLQNGSTGPTKVFLAFTTYDKQLTIEKTGLSHQDWSHGSSTLLSSYFNHQKRQKSSIDHHRHKRSSLFSRVKEDFFFKCHHYIPRKFSKMSSLFSQAKKEKVHGRNRLPESAGALPRGCGKTSASQVRG